MPGSYFSDSAGAAGATFTPLAFIARLPFAMMVVGVLTMVVDARESLALGGLVAVAALIALGLLILAWLGLR